MSTRLIRALRTKAIVFLLLPLVTCSALTISAEVTSTRDRCPVTLPSHWPATSTDIPWATDGNSSRGWYGSGSLAALLPNDGVWVGMGAEKNYGDKFWWWRSGYNAHDEPNPDLTLSAVRLDGLARPIEIDNATNAFGRGWHAMLVGMAFPTGGCWEIRGTYNGKQQLIVVVFVADE